MIRPLAGASFCAFSSSTSACNSTCSSKFVDAGTLLGRNRHEGRIATVLFGNDAFGDQFLLDAIRIGIRLVHLVDRHDQRHTGRLGMVNRFLGLRHHAVVGRHHQNDDVGRLGAAGTHRGKRFVTRGVEEGDHAAVGFDVVGADVLGNAAGFAGRHLGAADVVEQRGLAMVDVTHDGDHRRPRLQRHILVFGRLFEEGIRIVELGGKRLVAHFLDDDHRRFLVQHLVDGDHRTHLHHDLDDFDRLDRHLVRQIGHGNGFRNMDFTHDDFGRRLEAALTIIRRMAVLLVTVTATLPGTARIGRARLDARFFAVVVGAALPPFLASLPGASGRLCSVPFSPGASCVLAWAAACCRACSASLAASAATSAC